MIASPRLRTLALLSTATRNLSSRPLLAAQQYSQTRRRMASKAIPILATGKGETVGRVVAENLKPEYEVIHFTLADSVDKELPLLLKGELPDPASSAVGSGNWSSPPRALVLGGAYGEADIARLRGLLDATPGFRRIPWLHVDSSKPAPPPGPDYALLVVKRVKEGLKKLEEEGKLDGEDDGVYLV